MAKFDWLPAEEPNCSESAQTYALLHGYYQEDLIKNTCVLDGKDVKCTKHVKAGQTFPHSFLHLVTREDVKTGLRLFDENRARKIRWIKPFIENCYEEGIFSWRNYYSGKETVLHIWCPELKYIVILKEYSKGNYYILKTAYSVDDGYEKNRIQKSYNNRLD